MATPDLAIIVTTYQMPGHLRRALESIVCQRTCRQLEVIVADDGSLDETPQIVAEFSRTAPFPVRFATHPHRGFHPARSRNDGVRNSTAPHLLFFDGDCVLPPDHVEKHLAVWRPRAVVCGAPVRLEESVSRGIDLDAVRRGDFVHSAPPAELGKLAAIHRKFWFYNLLGHPTKPALKSTDFSIARADFERINGFDEQFRGWGCEDDDFGRRAKAAGLRLTSVLDRTRVYHLWHPPAPSKPTRWGAGSNVGYLQRSLRLTRCLKGLSPRRWPRDLTVHLAKQCQNSDALDQLLQRHGWQVLCDPNERADLELVTSASRGRWSGRGDIRVLAVVGEAAPLPRWARQAQVVLSKSGTAGAAHQVPVRIDDPAGLLRALAGIPLSDASQTRPADQRSWSPEVPAPLMPTL